MQKKMTRCQLITCCFVQLITLSSCGKNKTTGRYEQNASTIGSLNSPQHSKKKTNGKNMQTLPSGLRYEITQEAPANQRAAQRGNQVTVHYTGWLNTGNDQKGKVFDSSVTRGQKFTFLLGAGQVIQGWDQGIQNMKIGEKRMLYIPAQLAYGNRAIGNQIPANADLIFEVELFEIK